MIRWTLEAVTPYHDYYIQYVIGPCGRCDVTLSHLTSSQRFNEIVKPITPQTSPFTTIGIDVLAVHPSPVSSNFFDKAHKLESLEVAKGAAVSADTVRVLLNCRGLQLCHTSSTIVFEYAIILMMTLELHFTNIARHRYR